MKIYVGLGGIGCRTLSEYQRQHIQDEDKQFYYIDTEKTEAEDKNCYIVSNAGYGTGTKRYLGRNLLTYELHRGNFSDFFSNVKSAENVELIFVLSSFGGFGGAVIIPVMDYLEAIVWEKLKGCSVIAFNEAVFESNGFPKLLLQHFQLNTIEYVADIYAREQEWNPAYNQHNYYNPGCTSFLIDTRNIQQKDFWKYLDYPATELKNLDRKEAYRTACRTSRKRPEVFISYSSKDQGIADRIADKLEKENLSPWIASRDIGEGSYPKQIMQAIKEAKVFLVIISKNAINSEHVKNEIDRAFSRLHDGMKIMPFVIDDSELDDECQYYLCRQEMFSGKVPPIDIRIEELIDKIKGVLSVDEEA